MLLRRVEPVAGRPRVVVRALDARHALCGILASGLFPGPPGAIARLSLNGTQNHKGSDERESDAGSSIESGRFQP